jgi:transposase
MNKTIVGVDLAKKVIQVCIYRNKKVQSNTEMTPDEFLSWLVTSKPVFIVFEACAMSNYWKQRAIEAGHDARLISAKLVSAVRQNQKTDKNDALAIVQVSLLPEVRFISGKSVKQQQLQSIKRLRELAVKHRDALKKQIVALLLELNIRAPNGIARLINKIDDILEDAENELSAEFRQALQVAQQQLSTAIKAVMIYDDCSEKSIQAHPECKKLLKLEGVGPINAINLYIALGCAELGAFNKGKDASACIGLTPAQHSSGGKVKIGTIGKVKNSILRSQLISGAMSVVKQVVKREARTKKDVWLKNLIERRGNKCAAVALANKTVRTAFAMLTQGTEYKAELLAA